MDSGETEAPHIELIEPENDLNPILAGTETLIYLAQRQNISNIEQEQDMGIAKDYGTLKAAEQIIDSNIP